VTIVNVAAFPSPLPLRSPKEPARKDGRHYRRWLLLLLPLFVFVNVDVLVALCGGVASNRWLGCVIYLFFWLFIVSHRFV